MQNLIKRLEKRGWGKREIAKAIKIIQKAKQSKPEHVKFLDKRIYWVLLIIVIVANFAISIALLPILIALKGFFLYFVIIVLGAIFGLLFELVIRSIERLEKKHHLLLAVLIPLIALVSILIISKISNDLISMLGLENPHNTMLIGLVYAASFVMPYIIYRFVLKIEYYAKE